MKAKRQELATAFAKIVEASAVVERMAEGVLSAVKTGNAKTLEQFDAMVKDAYQQNGWSQQAGRPSLDSKLTAAPRAVKQYVSLLRGAYRLKLKVLTYETMEDIKKAYKDARAAQVIRPAEKDPEFKGISFSGEVMNGSFWHDVLVLSKHLPEEQRPLFQAQVKKVYDKYVKAAPEEILAAA